MTAEEKLKMLMSTGEFDFIKEIPKDALWKLLFMAAFVSDTARFAQPERKKGKWIPVDSFSAFGGEESMWMAHGNPVAFYYCSNCKEQAYVGEDGQSLITDFCPNCGADMRGEKDD